MRPFSHIWPRQFHLHSSLLRLGTSEILGLKAQSTLTKRPSGFNSSVILCTSWLAGLLQSFNNLDSVIKADVYVGLIQSSWDKQKNHTLIIPPASLNIRGQEDPRCCSSLCWVNAPFIYTHLSYDTLTLPVFIQQEIWTEVSSVWYILRQKFAKFISCFTLSSGAFLLNMFSSNHHKVCKMEKFSTKCYTRLNVYWANCAKYSKYNDKNKMDLAPKNYPV